MGKITAITPQIKNKKRCNIFIDGEYRCSLDKMTVVAFFLKEGMEIDEEKLSKIVNDSEQKSAFDAGVKYLCIRRRTEKETISYLEGKNYSPEVIESTASKLKEYGYLGDGEFCKAYIRTYRQKYGNKKLVYDLARLGVEQSIIDKYIDEEGEGEEDACEKAAEKYIRTHSKQITSIKLVTFLYGKGFDIDLAKSVAKKYASQE